MALDLSHLIASLGALERAQGIPADAAARDKLPPTVREAVRAGVIQTFFRSASDFCLKPNVP
ncbi:MAG: hypothetical protein Q8O29_06415 [Polaromonas sp.]|uniref:hypothetical protein n=1 Tax=Polaromonas sp. TaxID=1869339 RepID=UPI0027338F88|nr:hypothetical protein [Polaromonas sp.]MDP2817904.1 hypothetical protein [Polaromonas sp.]